jgi:hypothetical protein
VGPLLWDICVRGEASSANGFLIADVFVESICNKWPESIFDVHVTVHR